MRRLITGIFVLGLAVSLLPSAWAQSLMQKAEFYPLVQQGNLTGCQIGFSVLRSDTEYNDGRPVLANGLILFNSNGTLGLRLGIATDSELIKFAPPDRAYLFGRLKSNATDFAEKFDSSELGFRFFVFKLGNETTNILMRLMESGSVDVLYAPPAAIVDARFTLDFNTTPKPFAEFLDCISALLKQRE